MAMFLGLLGVGYVIKEAAAPIFDGMASVCSYIDTTLTNLKIKRNVKKKMKVKPPKKQQHKPNKK